MMIIVVPFMKHAGMALYPFILVNRRELKNDAVLINHERIHLRQQLELAVIPFYFLYLFSYLYDLYRFGEHTTAYHQIPFEREAYSHERNLNYLTERKMFAWTGKNPKMISK